MYLSKQTKEVDGKIITHFSHSIIYPNRKPDYFKDTAGILYFISLSEISYLNKFSPDSR